MDRTVLHIDFDSFFASCEQQFDPKLRGKPIGVTAANGRTCIIAASREAKALGIKSPSRTWETIKIVPNMIFVPAHFEKYWEITQKFLNICKDYSPLVELFSLDEAFIDLTPTSHLFGGKQKVIAKIKERIRSEIGEYITVSVGISHNRLLAKLASGLRKPNARPLLPDLPAMPAAAWQAGQSDGERGVFEITRENVWDVYAKIGLTSLCGIGERVKIRLNKIGIYTPLDLRNAPLDLLIKEFKDAEGHFLKSLGEASDDSEVIPYYTPSETKSVGRNYCLPQNTYDQRFILQNVYELCEEVGIKLRRLNKKGRTVGLYLGGNRSEHGRKTLKDYIDRGWEIYELCKALYDDWEWDKAKDKEQGMVRQISVFVGNLENSVNLTLPLFSDRTKFTKALNAMDQINERFGDHTIRNGFLLYGPNLKTVPNGYMADRYERSKLYGRTDSVL